MISFIMQTDYECSADRFLNAFVFVCTVLFWIFFFFFFCYEIEKWVFGDAKAGNPSCSTHHKSSEPADGCKAGPSLLVVMLLLLPLPSR